MKGFSLVFFLCLSHSWTAVLSQSNLPSKFVTVSGKKMAYKAFGLENRKPGQAIILFESGLGAGGDNYEPLFTSLEKGASGIAYDRNGLGRSEIDSTIKSDADVVRRFHTFLAELKIAPPYVLVGHSLGGAFIRLYTSFYPEEVAGLVFIDPTDFMLTNEEDQLVRTRSKSAIGYQKLWPILLKKMESDTLTPVGIRYEMSRQYNASVPIFFKEYRSISALPPIPTTVFIAYNRRIEQHELALSKELKINLKPWFKELDQIRIQHYSQMIENSPQSRLILLPQYSHGIHQQDPILVSNAILELLKTIAVKPK